MSTPAHTDYPVWTIEAMKSDQIPVVVSWIIDLAPDRGIDADQVADQMLAEWTLAQRSGLIEFFIGSLDDQPAFLLNGYQNEKDYTLFLLMSTSLNGSYELHSAVWRQALGFLFDRSDISSVVVELDPLDHLQLDVMIRSGFRPVKTASVLRPGYLSYACQRSKFMDLSV